MTSDAEFLVSLQTPDSEIFPLDGFDQWFREAIARHHFQIEQIPFRSLEKWHFDKSSENIVHESGKFFSIEGLSVQTNFGEVPRWTQPIINQPEIGFLGLIAKRINGVLHFLMQAKMEPGNINIIQLSPTLQATKSNYTRVHKGKSPPFIEFFHDSKKRKTLVDVLQSEQGGRFLRKRNRNIIIEINHDTEIERTPDFIWLTLGQIATLLKRNNVVNMDARTVLSSISYHRPRSGNPRETEWDHSAASSLHSEDDILSWFTEMKCRYELVTERIPLRDVKEWQHGPNEIYHPSRNFFSVIAVRVEADNREVPSWTQPLIKPCKEGIIALIAKSFNGCLHFLIQAKVEAGNFDVVEMAPTVQCLTGDYKRVSPEKAPPYLQYVLSAANENILFDTLQSEEGGRFFREENRNMIVMAGDDFPSCIPDSYIWISYNQLKKFIRFNNFVNIQCRCLLSGMAPLR